MVFEDIVGVEDGAGSLHSRLDVADETNAATDCGGRILFERETHVVAGHSTIVSRSGVRSVTLGDGKCGANSSESSIDSSGGDCGVEVLGFGVEAETVLELLEGKA